MKRVLLLTAILAATLASCSKSNVPDLETSSLVDVTFKGNTSLTKVTIGSVEDDIVNFIWGKNDRLGIFLLDEDSQPVAEGQNKGASISSTESSGPGFHNAYFSTKLPLEGNSSYTARIFYPYRGDAGSCTSIHHTIPGDQYQHGASVSNHIPYTGAFAFANAPFTTPSDISSYSPEIGFELSYKNSFIWVVMKAADASAAGWKVTSVQVKAPEGKLISGQTAYSPSDDKLTVTDGSNVVNLHIGGGAALSQTADCKAYIAAAPCALAGSNLLFVYTLEKDGVIRHVTHTKQIKAESEALAAGVTHYFEESIPSADAEGWVYSEAETYDLSAGGTANCYIAYAPGSYSFDASVIGNGSDGLMLPAASTFFHTSDATIAPASAKLLWQTSAGLISNVSLSAGRISFTKGNGVGNALIAALAADGSTILWSWHIWCTEIGPAVENTGSYTTFMMMDRNLGATYASSTLITDQALADRTAGLYYQWGRKDPFPGPEHLQKNSAQQKVYDENGAVYTLPAATASSATVGTQAWAASHPSTFITSTANNADWFYGPSGVTATGSSNRGYSFWGNPEPNNYTSSTPGLVKKTIYDPCPAGWMIPQEDVWGGGLTYKSAQSGMGCLISSAGGDSWYPYSNLLSWQTGAISGGNIGSYGYIWSSGFGNSSTPRTVWKMQYSTSKTNTTSWGNAYGFSVRCCQEY